jgi:uncharacterized damage-inducible protein DinB
MDFLRVYDVQLQARAKLLDWTRGLDQEQYIRRFPFGYQSLRGTLVEIAAAEMFLSMRLREEPLPPIQEWPVSEERLPTFTDLERIWAPQWQRTRATLAETTDWDRTVTCRLIQPGKILRLTATKADIATQLLTHEVHHRAQAMAMLRQLGIEAQNLDYILFVQTAEPES